MNILYFNPDEMRADVLGCYGHPLVRTPNFDRLAGEGVRFEQCHVQHTVCSPSRCSFLTGWYPHTRGHRSLWHLLRPEEPNTFRYLKEAGYEVHWSGKNDVFSPGSFSPSVSRVYECQGVATGAQRPPEGDPHHQSFLYGPMEREPADRVHVEHCIEFLRNRGPDDPPFLFFISSALPHPPYTCPEPWYSMYRPEDVPPLRPADLKAKPSFHRLIRRSRGLDRLDDFELRRIMAVYLGMVSYVDHLLGRLLDALDETGLAESTAVFAFSDHGDWAGDYGLVEKWSAGVDDALTRVPLIVRAPGAAASSRKGHVVQEPVECFDIMATTLELAGVAAMHTHDARSLMPQLAGEAGDPDRAAFTEGGFDPREPHCFEGKSGVPDDVGDRPEGIYYVKGLQQQEHPESTCRTVSIRTMTHRLVRRTSGEHELYDLGADPRELLNRWGDPDLAQRQARLNDRLLEWYLRTSDAPQIEVDRRGFPPGVPS